MNFGIDNSTPSEIGFIFDIRERKVFDLDATIFLCEVDTASYTDASAKNIVGDSLFTLISNCAIQRKAEFIAGRLLARLALQKTGAETTSVYVGPNSEPIWPETHIGSISHCRSRVICIVSSKKKVKRLGVDIESLIRPEMVSKIQYQILSNSERQNFMNCECNRLINLTIGFSAKESLFKALYPEIEQFFDFDSVKLIDINHCDQEFHLKIVNELSSQVPAGTEVTGRYIKENSFVITLIEEKTATAKSNNHV